MKRIQWPDGVTAEAPTWGALLKQLRLDPWNTMNALKFRFVLRRRAEIAGGHRIPTLTVLLASATKFMRALADAKLFTVVEDS